VSALLFRVAPPGTPLLKVDREGDPQKLIEASLPSVDDVTHSGWRIRRLHHRQSLGSPGLDLFRLLVADYERDNDIPNGRHRGGVGVAVEGRRCS